MECVGPRPTSAVANAHPLTVMGAGRNRLRSQLSDIGKVGNY
ncbi:MAG: hypothetical protein ACLSUW_08405 [Akkermansia sp.]